MHVLEFFSIVYSTLVVITHIIMALAVNADAKHLVTQRSGLFLFGSTMWGLVTLIFGIAGLALYWAVHHSGLRVTTPPQDR